MAYRLSDFHIPMNLWSSEFQQTTWNKCTQSVTFSRIFEIIDFLRSMHGIQMWQNSIWVLKPQLPEWWAQYEVFVDSVKERNVSRWIQMISSVIWGSMGFSKLRQDGQKQRRIYRNLFKQESISTQWKWNSFHVKKFSSHLLADFNCKLQLLEFGCSCLGKYKLPI